MFFYGRTDELKQPFFLSSLISTSNEQSVSRLFYLSTKHIVHLFISYNALMKAMFSEENNAPPPPPTPTQQLVQEIECRQGSDIFTVFIVWWPWKLGQRSPKSNQFFKYPSYTIHKVWPEYTTGFMRLSAGKLFFFGQNLTFKVLVWPWKWGQGHQNLIISSPCPNGVSLQVWSKSTN